jgi:hypothetical protein
MLTRLGKSLDDFSKKKGIQVVAPEGLERMVNKFENTMFNMQRSVKTTQEKLRSLGNDPKATQGIANLTRAYKTQANIIGALASDTKLSADERALIEGRASRAIKTALEEAETAYKKVSMTQKDAANAAKALERADTTLISAQEKTLQSTRALASEMRLIKTDKSREEVKALFLQMRKFKDQVNALDKSSPNFGKNLNNLLKDQEKRLQRTTARWKEYKTTVAGAGTGTDRLKAKMQDLSKSVQVALGPLSGVASRLTAITALASKNTAAIAGMIGALIGFGAFAAKALAAGANFEKQLLQLSAVIRVTGREAETSVGAMNDFAEAFAEATLAGTTEARSAVAAALFFRNISSETAKSVVQLGQVLTDTFGGSLVSNTQRLARALNAPAKSFDQLRRLGVELNFAQKELVTRLVRTGDAAKAQKIILDEFADLMDVSTDAAKGLAGAYDTLKERIQKFLESTGETSGAVRALTKAVNEFSNALDGATGRGLAASSAGETMRLTFEALTFAIAGLVSIFDNLIVLLTLVAGNKLIKVFLKLLGVTGKWKFSLIGIIKSLGSVKKAMLGLRAIAIANPWGLFLTGATIALPFIIRKIKEATEAQINWNKEIKRGQQLTPKQSELLTRDIERAKDKLEDLEKQRKALNAETDRINSIGGKSTRAPLLANNAAQIAATNHAIVLQKAQIANLEDLHKAHRQAEKDAEALVVTTQDLASALGFASEMIAKFGAGSLKIDILKKQIEDLENILAKFREKKFDNVEDLNEKLKQIGANNVSEAVKVLVGIIAKANAELTRLIKLDTKSKFVDIESDITKLVRTLISANKQLKEIKSLAPSTAEGFQKLRDALKFDSTAQTPAAQIIEYNEALLQAGELWKKIQKDADKTGEAQKRVEAVADAMGFSMEKVKAELAASGDNTEVWLKLLQLVILKLKSIERETGAINETFERTQNFIDAGKSAAEKFGDELGDLRKEYEALLKLNAGADPEVLAKIEASFENQRRLLLKTTEEYQMFQETVDGIFDQVGSAIEEAFLSGADAAQIFRDAALGVLQDVWKQMFKLAVSNPLQNMFDPDNQKPTFGSMEKVLKGVFGDSTQKNVSEVALTTAGTSLQLAAAQLTAAAATLGGGSLNGLLGSANQGLVKGLEVDDASGELLTKFPGKIEQALGTGGTTLAAQIMNSLETGGSNLVSQLWAVLSNSFGGGGGGGGILGTLVGGAMSIFGGGGGDPLGLLTPAAFGGGIVPFAKGGEFTVGGVGGTDSKSMRLALTPGEHVQITPPHARGGGGGNTINMNFNGSDNTAFGRDPNQVAAQAMRLLRVADNRFN